MDQQDRLTKALAHRYTIEREIGSGGMATVYLATDVRHERKVALKVLRSDLAASLGAERFLQEVRVTANLQHPHILPLFDSGEADGFLFYVMPFIEGESLRERLVREHELPVTEAARLLRDVVDALAAAHKLGVVHRDIKPENVLISGRHAMVADFGVAKAVSEATGRHKLTTLGVALGTPSYMAPEQAAADEAIDHRADIYAVGVMAYELLAGRPPFSGSTPQQILAAQVIEAPQPLTELRASVPPALGTLIMRCLEKKPADRWQSAEEMLPHLESAATPSGGITPTDMQPVTQVSGTLWRRLGPAGIGIAALLALAGGSWSWLRSDEPLTITTSNITQVTRGPGVEYQPALSPDGNEVAYLAGPIATPRLVVRSTLDIASGGESHPATEVPGNHWAPSWSPDGASVSLHACPRGDPGATLWPGCSWRQVGKLGGAPRTLSLPHPTRHYAWSQDGNRVVYSSGDSLFSLAPGDAAPRLLGVHTVDRWTPHSLTWSPDGRWIAYVNGNPIVRTSGMMDGGWSSIWIISAEGGEPIPITGEVFAMSPQWLPDSRHILFVSNRDGVRAVYVVGAGADGARGEARPVPGATDPHSISLSADGRKLAYAKFAGARNIWSIPIPRSGVASIRDAVPVTTGNRSIGAHSLSRDEQWIVFDVFAGGASTINKVPVTGGIPQRMAVGNGPNWSPDDTEIAFTHWAGSEEGKAEIFIISAEGEHPTRLTFFPLGDVQADWAPDGLHLAYQSQGRDGTEPWTLWMLSRDSVGGSWGTPTRIFDSTCHSPAWAPDGASILCALWCRECRPTATENALIRVTPEGEMLSRYETGDPEWVTRPKFSRDGSVVYFVGSESDGSLGLWSMSLDGGEATKMVAFDDPELSVVRLAGHSDAILSVGEEHFFITLAEYESDIWVMDLEW